MSTALLVEDVSGNDELVYFSVSKVSKTSQLSSPKDPPTSSPLRSQLVGNSSLALLPVSSLRLDRGISTTLSDHVCPLTAHGSNGRECRTGDCCHSSHNRPLQCEEPHGRGEFEARADCRPWVVVWAEDRQA